MIRRRPASWSSVFRRRCKPSRTTTRCCTTRSWAGSRGAGPAGPGRLAIARARVTSGAAVQSDSLQLTLELTRARMDQLRRDAALTVARLELGRRVGEAGPVDAVPLDTAAARVAARPDEAVQWPGPGAAVPCRPCRRARGGGVAPGGAGAIPPQRQAVGTHRASTTDFSRARRNMTSITLSVTIPIWDDGRREIAVTQARVNRDVARAIREDLERAARRDVTAGVRGVRTARARPRCRYGVVVARENYRVQESRYRAGATTILDVLDAQISLTQAEADWSSRASSPAGTGRARSDSGPPTLLEQGRAVRPITRNVEGRSVAAGRR